MKTLDDLFLAELKTIYDAQCRVGRMLMVVASASRCWTMKKAIHSHMLDTEDHVMKLEKVFETIGVPVTGTTSKITLGLVETGAEIALEYAGTPAINAALISFLQKIEYYEIAAYTVLHEWALLLGNEEAAALIDEILEGEHAANQTWFELGRSTSNEEALGKNFHEEPQEAFEPRWRSFRPV